MTRARLVIGRRALAGGALFALAGCASLLGVPAPGKLYRLTAPRNFGAGLPRVDAQLLIDLPQAPAGIDSNRIALSRSPLSLDYFADAEWTARLPELIQNLLLAAFENSGAISAVDLNSGGLRADFVLRSDIRHFEAVYDTANAPPRVWVEIVTRLTAVRRRAIVAEGRFEQHTAAAANDIPAIVRAFNTASEAVLRDIVIWTLGNPALSQPRHRLI
ncbi:MAG TPA: ABC-type transport auxiliary lipoprotein family protein [Stellaceae bacterium]